MTANPCPLCERPAGDATLCTSCSTETAAMLRDVLGHRRPVPAGHPEVVEHRARHGQHCGVDPKHPDVNRRQHGSACPPLGERERWVPGLLDALDGLLSRQARIPNGMPRIGPVVSTKVLAAVSTDHDVALAVRVQPLPYVEQASMARARLASALQQAAAAVAIPTDDPIYAAHRLVDRLEQLRHHPDAARLTDRLWRAVDTARQTVDRPADARYAGPCDDGGPAWQVVAHARTVAGVDAVPMLCDGQLYAEDGAASVTCSVCGTSHDVTARRQWLLDQAEDRLASIGVLAALLSEPGREVTRKMLDGYVERGRLVAHGRETRGTRVVALYRVADARALVNERARKVAG